MSEYEYNSIIWLSQGKYSIVDNEDYGSLSKWKWSYVSGYAIRIVSIDGKSVKIYMHRLINNTPTGMQTDHINRIRSDNRKSNLRTVTNRINSLNRVKAVYTKRKVASFYKGVCLNANGRRWIAQFAGKYLGTFDKEEQAAAAYNRKAQELYGSQVPLNVIN